MKLGGVLLTVVGIAVLFGGLVLENRSYRPASTQELRVIEQQFVAEYGPTSLSSLEQPFVLRMALREVRSKESWLLVSCFTLWWGLVAGGVALMDDDRPARAPSHR